MAKRSDINATLKSMFAWRKASTDASLGTSPAASSLDTEVNSISARKGCPKADKTVSFPKPAACAVESSSTDAMAALSVFMLNEPSVGRFVERIFGDIEGIPFACLGEAKSPRQFIIVPGNFHLIIMDLGAQV
jgi:hypothetical protein